MTIGEKIRQARLELGLSQRQLCADQVTRNMLSQIENGAARPSMDTLSYFARRLGKPVSYFLDEDTLISPNQTVMEDARSAFLTGAYADALTALNSYRSPDPVFDGEKGLLENLCRLFLARIALQDGRVPYAHRLLEDIAPSPYFTAALEREKLLLQGALPPADDRELLLRAEHALAGGDPRRALAYLTAAEDHSALGWDLLCGKAYFAQSDYQNALPHLQKAEPADPKGCLSALEVCYREMGDYENAYRCACKLREL